MRSSALRPASGWPLETSMRSHERAAIAGGGGDWAAVVPHRETSRQKSRTAGERDIDATAEKRAIIPARLAHDDHSLQVRRRAAAGGAAVRLAAVAVGADADPEQAVDRQDVDRAVEAGQLALQTGAQ